MKSNVSLLIKFEKILKACFDNQIIFDLVKCRDFEKHNPTNI